jgi:hypothetical protein
VACCSLSTFTIATVITITPTTIIITILMWWRAGGVHEDASAF